MSAAVEPQEWIVSVDDHVLEPPDLWVSRAPADLRDRVPHIERGDDGLVYWVFDQFRTPIAQTVVDPGRRGSPLGQFVRSYEELEPAYYDPKARLEAMNADHVFASMCFRPFRGSAARRSSNPPTTTSPCCACRPTTIG